MLSFYDKGMWTYVAVEGPRWEEELTTLRGMLCHPLPEGILHPWAQEDLLIHYLRDDAGDYPRFFRGVREDIAKRLTEQGIQVAVYPQDPSPENPDDFDRERIYHGLRDHQKEVMAVLLNNDHGIFQAAPRFGKCVSGDTLVFNASSGKREPIRDLVGKAFKTLASDGSGKIGPHAATCVASGTKACVRVTLASRQTLDCTPDHRVLTEEGWVEAQDLTSGSAPGVRTAHHEGPNGLQYEKVLSVEPLGERDVYDLGVPTAGNFVANGIVVHNSYLMAGSYALRNRPRTLVLVDRAAIIRQSVTELSEFLDEEVGYVCSSVGKPKLKNLTFASPKSLIRNNAIREEYVDFLNEIEMLYADEIHIFGGQMMTVHFATPNRKVQWGFSATPDTDDQVKNFERRCLYGPPRLEMDSRATTDMGVTSGMHVRWLQATVDLSSFTRPEINSLRSVYNRYVTKAVVENAALNQQAAEIAKWHLSQNQRVLIFVDRVEHGRLLGDLIPTALLNVGTVTMDQQDANKRLFNSGEEPCVITTKRWREGVTVEADVMINLEGMKAKHVAEQRSGRGQILKESGLALLHYDVFYNDAPWGVLAKHSQARHDHYTTQKWPMDVYPQATYWKLTPEMFNE